jgi:hypothetical protein
VVDPETVTILESVLVAVDHVDAPAITFTSSEYGWLEATA